MNLKLPIASSSPLTILRQWASEVRNVLFLTEDDYKFNDILLEDFSIVTIATSKASPPYYIPTLTGVNVIQARALKKGDLIHFKFRLQMNVTFASSQTGPEYDIRILKFKFPYKCVIAQNPPLPENLTGLNAILDANSNPFIVWMYGGGSGGGIAQYGGGYFYRTDASTQEGAVAPRNYMQVSKFDRTAMGLVPTQAGGSSTLIDGCGFLETVS